MFALSFTHEYGTDITLYATIELAERAGCRIIADWFNDFADLDGSQELAEHINAGEYSQALMLWGEMDHMETMSIQAVTLRTEVPFPERIQIDADEE